MDIKIHSDFYNVNLNEMLEVYRSVGWTKHTNEIIRQEFIGNGMGSKLFQAFKAPPFHCNNTISNHYL